LNSIVIVSLVLLPCLGCGEQNESSVKAKPVPSVDAASPPGTVDAIRTAAPGDRSGEQHGRIAILDRSGGAADGGVALVKPQGAGLAAQVKPQTARKIIYNAQVDMVVANLKSLSASLTRLVNESGGYVAETDETALAQTRGSASWKVRVPVGQFGSFLDALETLGEVRRKHLDSQDVTQEYFDVEANVSNKQQEEKRLQKHLQDSTGKLEDILKVEKELSRVRGEIEHLQGRVRYLASMSSLSTVTITASELQDDKPPVSPTFSAQVGRAFFNSVSALVAFGKGVAILAATAVPWLPLIAIGVLILIKIARKSQAAGSPRQNLLGDPAGK
jgi:hypothetical protein